MKPFLPYLMIFAASGLPLVASSQSNQYNYRLFDPVVTGPRFSIQLANRFYDDGSYMGQSQHGHHIENQVVNQGFIKDSHGFQLLPRIHGYAGYPAEAIDRQRNGTIVGYDSDVSPTGVPSVAVWTWKNGVSSVLPRPVGFSGYPVGIADNGDVAGWMWKNPTTNATYQAVAWLGGQFTELDGGGLSSICRGVDGSGAMYGNVMRPDGTESRPVVWRNGVRSELTGFEGYSNVNIQRVSRGGTVAGYLFDPSINEARMFVMIGGSVRILPREKYTPWGFEVIDVNDSGMMIARNMYDFGANLGEAFMVYRDGVAQFWEQSYTLTTTFRPWRPTAINNRGDIIGIAHASSNHDSKLFIATPVPEPASLAALTLGLAGVLLRRRRSRNGD